MKIDSLLRIPYRVVQKLSVFEITKMLVASTDRVALGRRMPGVERLGAERLAAYVANGEAPGCEPFVGRLGGRGLHCFAAVEGGRLLSFAWLNERLAEPVMNYGYDPGTAVGMRLVDDAAFLFHVYTAPEARGRGWMGAVLRCAAETLRRERGVQTLVSTTEVINRPARAAFKRIGFCEQPGYWRMGFGERVTGWYPPARGPVVAYG